MAERRRFGLKEIRALQPNQQIWDSLPGFFARRQTGTTVSFGVFYRTASGRQRWHSIGRYGPLTVEQARAEAQRLLGLVALGGDPASDKRERRQAMSMRDLCDRYMEDAISGRHLTKRGRAKKASTLESDRTRIDRHIIPLLGHIAVRDLSQKDVERFLVAVAEGKTARTIKLDRPHALSRTTGGQGAASRSVILISALMAYAIKHGHRPPPNPCHEVTLYASQPRHRRLSDVEYQALGQGLRAAEAEQMWPPAIGCIRFLCLTGWRSSEALNLTWDAVDLARRVVVLADSKTGRSVRPLSRQACAVLEALPRLSDGTLVFPGSRGKSGILSGLPSFLGNILKRAGLDGTGVTPHVLRHSFASCAADLDFAEFTIAALLGHATHSVTSRYVHRSDPALLSAADRVASHIAGLMGFGPPEAEVVPLRTAVG
jgi:integrase